MQGIFENTQEEMHFYASCNSNKLISILQMIQAYKNSFLIIKETLNGLYTNMNNGDKETASFILWPKQRNVHF
jgi:hypothetical protein